MGYPLDCRRCGGYGDHKADCPQLREWREEREKRQHEELLAVQRSAIAEGRRERLVAAALTGVATLMFQHSAGAIASKAVMLADAALAEMEKAKGEPCEP